MNRERTETSSGATGRPRAMDALRRGAFFALAVVLGFLLLELPWNDGVFAIPTALRHRQPAHPGAGLRHHCFWRDSAPAHRWPSSRAFACSGAPPISSSSPSRGSPSCRRICSPSAPPPRWPAVTACSSRGAWCSAGRCSPPIASPWRSCAPNESAPAGTLPPTCWRRPCWCASAPCSTRPSTSKSDCEVTVDVWDVRGLLRHPGHRALLPFAGPRAHAQASGGLLRRGRGHHPGPLRRGSVDDNGRRDGRARLARRNGRSGTRRRPPLAMQHRSSPKHSPTTGPTSSPS